VPSPCSFRHHYNAAALLSTPGIDCNRRGFLKGCETVPVIPGVSIFDIGLLWARKPQRQAARPFVSTRTHDNECCPSGAISCHLPENGNEWQCPADAVDYFTLCVNEQLYRHIVWTWQSSKQTEMASTGLSGPTSLVFWWTCVPVKTRALRWGLISK
jgi:hypothetical protein